MTTLGELIDALQGILDDGADPDSTVVMRTLHREPNLIADDPEAGIEDVWHLDGRVYLDEKGI